MRLYVTCCHVFSAVRSLMGGLQHGICLSDTGRVAQINSELSAAAFFLLFLLKPGQQHFRIRARVIFLHYSIPALS